MKKKKVFEQGGDIKEAILKKADSLNFDLIMISKTVKPILHFIISAIFGATMGPMGTYPFGVAVLCSAEGAANAACSFAGAMLGTLAMKHGGIWHMVILASVFVTRIVSSLVGGEKRLAYSCREPLYIRVTIASAAALGAGIVGILSTDGLYFGIVSAICGVLLYTSLTALLAFFTSHTATGTKKILGVSAVCYIVALVPGSFAIPFNIGIVFAFFVTVWFTYGGGVGYGVCVAVCSGLALGADNAVLFALLALVYGLVSRRFASSGIGIASLVAGGFGLANSGLEFMTDTFPEICLAAAITAPLIRFDLIKPALPAFLSCESRALSENPTALRFDMSNKRHKAIGDSLESLSKMLYSVCDKLRCPTEQEAYRMCTAARAKYCSGCRHEELCSGRCEREVSSFFKNMAYRLSAAGKVSAKIVPEELARRCYNIDSIIDCVNTSARRAAGISNTGAVTELFASDYSAVASLLKEVSDMGGEWERDALLEKQLCEALDKEGFTFSVASVYGSRSKHIFMRGIDTENMSAGENDIRTCAEGLLGCRLSPIEFSLDGGYISASMHTVPRFSIKTGRYSTAGVRDDTSGDSVSSFKNTEGYYYTLVSDGMGSGREAAIISGVSTVFLEKLLSAGCPMKSALEMLNCFVRGSDGEQFTTVDLMEADLYTGKVRFIKSGAAPSFVLRGGQLYRLHSKTVPVGIMRALDAESISFDVKEGDTIIMMSDGVTGSYEECPWLYSLLAEGLGGIDSVSACARLIGEAAEKNMGRDDDITVCVMKISAA